MQMVQCVAASATGVSSYCCLWSYQLADPLEELQLPSFVLRCNVAMDPAGHTIHANVDALLYRPAAHAVQLIAPAPASVLVTEPAGHVVHAAVDALLY
jgi:hypothetical protein